MDHQNPAQPRAAGCPTPTARLPIAATRANNAGQSVTITSFIQAERSRAIFYWVATALLAFELVLGGLWDVLRVPHVRIVFERLGYPSYLLVILGVWKLLGAVAVLIPRFPRLKEWAYAGAVFSMTGALVSHVASGDIEVGPMVYLVFMLGVTVASWSLRPPSRRNFPVS